MSSIDNRVVHLQFDNSQFEKGVKTSLSTIDKLKKVLNFDSQTKEIKNLQTTANNFDISGMADGVNTIKNRFDTLGIVGMTVIQNITTAATNAGVQIAKALSIQSVLDGYSEYETQINAVQTILANTQKEGTNIDMVNSALDTLNTYADKTIYNFTEMTRNIGTFTAAGVGLQTSVDSIQGIANLAAVSGSSSQQASTAMYQLSQAIAAGTVKLMDWNSVVNAGMGGQVFQDALIRTSEHLQTGAKAAIEAKGSFRESLAEGWLTVDVLTETLKQFSLNVESAEDYENVMADLVSQGYTEEEAKDIANMARTAMDAATKVKTFSQLIDTLKEELGSGWALSWRIIIGDFEDAKAMWTEVANVLQTAISNSSQLRNDMLQGWADLGGRTAAIEGLKNIFEALASIGSKVATVFREIFPRTTSEQLYDLTVKFKDFTEALKPSEERLNQIGRIAKGLFSVISMLKNAITSIIKPFGTLLGSSGIDGLIDGLIEAVASFADFFTAMNNASESSGIFSNVASGLVNVLKGLASPISKLEELFKSFGQLVRDLANVLKNSLGSALDWISNNVSWGDVLGGLTSAGIMTIIANISKLGNSFSDFIKNIRENFVDKNIINELKDSLNGLFTSLGTALQTFTSTVNASSLLIIAGAVATLVYSLSKLTELNFLSVVSNLPVVAVLIGTLTKNFRKLIDISKGLDPKSTLVAAGLILSLAEAINIMATAMQKLADIPTDKIIQGLGSIITLMTTLGAFLNKVDLSGKSMSAAGSMIIIAGSLVILSKAVSNIADLSLGGAIQGVVGITAALYSMVGALKILDGLKISASVSTTLLVISATMLIVANVLSTLGQLSWDEITRGLTAMGLSLVELVAVTVILDKFSGGKSLVGAAAVMMLTTTLSPIATALQEFAKLKTNEAKQALEVMGVALLELALVNGILGQFGGLSSIVAATSVLILVQSLEPIATALERFAKLDTSTAKKALDTMGVALLELALVNGILGQFGGLSSIVAATSVLILVQSLEPIANALQKFGSMSWDEIARGLTAMGGALVELGVVTGLLGNLGGFASLVGAGTILLVSQGLDDIANALQKFGSMSWDEINRGLEAMGSALGQIAFGSLLNTLGIIGGANIAQIAEPLGTLADSMKKWKDVQVPDNLKDQLYALSDGLMPFTWSGIGGAFVSVLAEPIGTLADSMKKWQGVQVPDNLKDQLYALSDGVGAFFWSGLGADAIATLAEPLGTLADSVQKWIDKEIPESVTTNLKSLAESIATFNGSLFAGFSMSTIVEPLGDLAGSVAKWKDVDIPENLSDGLKGLAKGVNNFSASALAGWSLGNVTGPLGDLADAVKKWKGVSVPDGIDEELKSLADGVNAFASALNTGWRLGSVSGAVKELGEGLSYFDNLSIPTTLESGLKALAAGINSFADTGSSMTILNESGGAFSVLGEGVRSLSDIDYNGISQNLNIFAQSMQSVPEQLSGVTDSIGNSIDILAGSISSQTGNVINAVSEMMNQVSSSLNTQNESFSLAGTNLIKSLMDGMNTGLQTNGLTITTTMRTTAQSITTAGLTEFQSQIAAYSNAAKDLITSFTDGIRENKQNAVTLCKSIGEDCLNAISSSNDGFYTAGYNMMMGLKNGIYDGKSETVNAAIQVATDALKSTKEALGEKSPSRITAQFGRFYDQGLINGMMDLSDKVRKSGTSVGKAALSGLSEHLDRADYNGVLSPVVTPVMNTANLQTLSGLNLNKNVMINAEYANGQIVNPISNLRESINKDNLEVLKSNNAVSEAISNLRDDLTTYSTAIANSETAMYIDGKKLASTIAKPINQQLGVLSRRGI